MHNLHHVHYILIWIVILQSNICSASSFDRDVPVRDFTSLSEIDFKRVRRDTTDESCIVPSNPELSFVLINEKRKERTNLRRGSKAARFSKVEATCNDGFALPNAGKKQQAYCTEEGWVPALRPCLKTCPKLKPENMELSCHYNDRIIDCNATELVSGTIVEVRCKPFYSQENKQINYRTLRCQQDGKWNNELYKCTQQCGRLNELEPFIYGGSVTSVEKAPWNVAIYRISLNNLLICGGTLISSRMVVSAAQCFFNQIKSEPLPAEDHEVIVSKYLRDHMKTDSAQKKHKIRKISVHEKYDPRNTGNYGFDIAVLILEKAVELSKFALPACVDWTASSGFNPGEGTLGQLVGWGVTEQTNDGNNPSETLLTAMLPYVSYQKCIKVQKSIPNDQFCAGSDTGPGARKGDSGAGLVFQNTTKNNRYFLRGIASTGRRFISKTSVMTSFTDISHHLKWLDSQRSAVENAGPTKAN